jgi:uncharacterized protein YkwD
MLIAALLVLVSAGCTAKQFELQKLVNDERAAAGLTPLSPSPHVYAKAQAWAEELAGTGKLSHSRLADTMPEGYLKIGENVGRGPGIGDIHTAFMASPGHRVNVLDPEYNWIGTGYAQSSNGVVYVAVVFAHY